MDGDGNIGRAGDVGLVLDGQRAGISCAADSCRHVGRQNQVRIVAGNSDASAGGCVVGESAGISVGNGEVDDWFGSHARFNIVGAVGKRRDDAWNTVALNQQFKATGDRPVKVVRGGNAHAELIGRNRARGQVTAAGVDVHVAEIRGVAEVQQIGTDVGCVSGQCDRFIAGCEGHRYAGGCSHTVQVERAKLGRERQRDRQRVVVAV